MHTQIYDVTLNVRLGKTLISIAINFFPGENHQTIIKSNRRTRSPTPNSLISPWLWYRQKKVNPKYAYGISFIKSDETRIRRVERLASYAENKEFGNKQKQNRKTQHIYAEKKKDELWKKCKYLGLWLDTTTNIIQRKVNLKVNVKVQKVNTCRKSSSIQK